MRETLKSLSSISNLHDLRTNVKSGKPPLPTTAILGLYMKKNEKMRIGSELTKIRKRKIQLMKRLKDVDREMSKLLTQALDTAEKLRGKEPAEKFHPKSRGKKEKKERVVVAY